MNIKKVISYRLQVNKYSRYKLATVLGVSPASVYRYLSEDQKVIGVDKLLKIGDILGISNYRLLLGIEEPSELIDHLDVSQAQSSFQKVIFHNILSMMLLEGSVGFCRLTANLAKYLSNNPTGISISNYTVVSLFLREYFLFSNVKSEIVENIINSESSKWEISRVDFDEYIASEHDIDSLSNDIKSMNRVNESMDHNSQKPSHPRFHPEFKNKISQVILIWNTDIYFNYLKGNYSYQETKNLLRITSRFITSANDDSDDFEHLMFQLFNFGKFNGSLLFSYDDLFTPGLTSVTTYTNLYNSKNTDINNVISGEVLVPSTLSSKRLIGLIIKQNSMEKEYPINSIAVIERDSDYNNGDTVAISINNDPYILSKVHILTDKLLVEFVGNGSEKASQVILEKNQVDVLGRVVYGIIPCI
ncbi:MAG: hypothetical protein FD179_1179 [Erysipelotrichaceae bacterium]|nr:MAG: hypothetical protein FD179_1179 [Erysipelotrichaceae bacterium]